MPIATPIDINDIEALKIFEYGLVMACPVNNNDPNPLSCPLHNVRLLSIAERFQWVDNLSEMKCVKVYKNFRRCSLSKAK